MRLMRRTTSSELLAVDRQLVLVGLGQQLAVVRELTVDQPRATARAPPTSKTTWLARTPMRISLDVVAHEAAELLERAGRHVGLEAVGQRRPRACVSLTLRR